MRILETSDVGIDERTDSLIFRGERRSPHSRPQMKMSSPKLGTNDLCCPDFTKKVKNLSSQSAELYELITRKEFKEELFRFSETIDLHAKSLLSDSGTESFLLPDSEEDEVSLNGTLLEGGQDPYDEVDSEDAESGTLTTVPPYNFSVGSEDLSEDSREMSSIELDLSSQNHEVSDDEMFLELMKNLNIGSSKISVSSDSCKFDPSRYEDRFDKNNPQNLERAECTERVSRFQKVVTEGAKSLNSDQKKSDFFVSFLSNKESGLCSLPERAYVKIAESLLDERTLLTLNAEENCLSDCGSGCIISMDTPNILPFPSEWASSNDYLKPLLSVDETDPTEKMYPMTSLSEDETDPIEKMCPMTSLSEDETDPTEKMCPMTYVELDVNGPSKETLKSLECLSIKDDMIYVCRGNPSEQNEIQNPPLDKSEFEDVASSPFVFGMADTQVDLSDFANGIGGVSMQDFSSSKTFPSSNAEFNFALPAYLPPFPKDYGAQTFETLPETNAIEEQVSSEISSLESSLFPCKDSSFHDGNNSSDVSFLDSNLESGIPYENEFVTENLHKLLEVKEILGLSDPDGQKTIPCLPPRFSSPSFANHNLPPCLFSKQMVVANHGAVQNSFEINTPQSSNSDVIPRVTTQTPGTQSDAIPTLSGIVVVLSTSSIHGLKRPPCSELTEPAKKLFVCDTRNNSWFFEADSRKKAKQSVDQLTDKQLSEFVNEESCLHEAVRSKNCEYVLALLKRLTANSDHREIINAKNGKNQTALHLAVQEKIPGIVHLLIKHGAEVNHLAMTPSNKLEAPLHYVASRGSQFKLVLRCLLEATDLDINIKNSEGQTALHCAAEAHGTGGSNSTDSIDCEYIIKKLLNCGADPLLQDNCGKNLLMYVIESKDLNLLSHIIKTVGRDNVQVLLAAQTTNGQTCRSLTYSLKEQFNPVQWDKINNILTRYESDE